MEDRLNTTGYQRELDEEIEIKLRPACFDEYMERRKREES
jgi:hypothetical protein